MRSACRSPRGERSCSSACGDDAGRGGLNKRLGEADDDAILMMASEEVLMNGKKH